MKCSQKNCENDQELYECASHNYVFCNVHTKEHLLTPGVHRFEVVNEFWKAKKAFLKKFLGKKEEVDELIKEMQRKKEEFLTHARKLFENAENFTKKLFDSIETSIQAVISCTELENNEFSQILNGSEKEIQDFFKEIQVPKMKIPDLPHELLIFKKSSMPLIDSYSQITDPQMLETDTDNSTYYLMLDKGKFNGQIISFQMFFSESEKEMKKFQISTEFIEKYSQNSLFLKYFGKFCENNYLGCCYEEVKSSLLVDILTRKQENSEYSLAEITKFLKDLSESLAVLVITGNYTHVSLDKIYITASGSIKIAQAFEINEKRNYRKAPEFKISTAIRYKNSPALIFSLGLVILSMYRLENLFLSPDFSENQIKNYLDTVKHQKIRELLSSMLSPNYSDRISLHSLQKSLSLPN